MNKKRRVTFAYVPSGYILGNSCNFISVDTNDYGLDIFALLGLFNSKCINWLFKLTSSNNHVNNTVYTLWSEDVLSENLNVKEVRINYRKAAMFKETIQVFTQQQENIFKVKYIKPDGEVAALVEMILQKQEEK